MTQLEFVIMTPSLKLYHIRTGIIAKGQCSVWVNERHYTVECTDSNSLRLAVENLIQEFEEIGN